jgi:hypothetical protein
MGHLGLLSHMTAGLASLLFAQEILTESRGYAIDIALVLALFGLALFVVCRSSRRT